MWCVVFINNPYCFAFCEKLVMASHIEYLHDTLPDEQTRKEIEKWVTSNRFQNVKVTEDAHVEISDVKVKIVSRTATPDESGISRIPFVIDSAVNVQFTCVLDNADALRSSFPKKISRQLLFSMGKMPEGVTDLSFFGHYNTHESVFNHVAITSNRGLTELTGCPQHVDNLEISRNADLTSLKGITRDVGGELTISMNPKLVSFHNIHQHIKSVGSHIIIDGCVQRDMLGLLMLEGLDNILIDHNDGRSPNADLKKAIAILNRFLKTPPSADRLLDCYEEMIEVGLSQYARL